MPWEQSPTSSRWRRQDSKMPGASTQPTGGVASRRHQRLVALVDKNPAAPTLRGEDSLVAQGRSSSHSVQLCTSVAPPPGPPPQQGHEPGAQVQVRSKTGKWRDGTVLEKDDDRVKIHYHGFSSRFDDWFDTTDAPLRLPVEPPAAAERSPSNSHYQGPEASRPEVVALYTENRAPMPTVPAKMIIAADDQLPPASMPPLRPRVSPPPFGCLACGSAQRTGERSRLQRDGGSRRPLSACQHFVHQELARVRRDDPHLAQTKGYVRSLSRVLLAKHSRPLPCQVCVLWSHLQPIAVLLSDGWPNATADGVAGQAARAEVGTDERRGSSPVPAARRRAAAWAKPTGLMKALSAHYQAIIGSKSRVQYMYSRMYHKPPQADLNCWRKSLL
jgi:hypothetical protein